MALNRFLSRFSWKNKGASDDSPSVHGLIDQYLSVSRVQKLDARACIKKKAGSSFALDQKEEGPLQQRVPRAGLRVFTRATVKTAER